MEFPPSSTTFHAGLQSVYCNNSAKCMEGFAMISDSMQMHASCSKLSLFPRHGVVEAQGVAVEETCKQECSPCSSKSYTDTNNNSSYAKDNYTHNNGCESNLNPIPNPFNRIITDISTSLSLSHANHNHKPTCEASPSPSPSPSLNPNLNPNPCNSTNSTDTSTSLSLSHINHSHRHICEASPSPSPNPIPNSSPGSNESLPLEGQGECNGEYENCEDTGNIALGGGSRRPSSAAASCFGKDIEQEQEYFEQILGSSSYGWTDEKHSSYLDSMEADFLRSVVFKANVDAEPSELADSASSQQVKFKVCQNGRWRPVCVQAPYIGPLKQYAVAVKNPWIKRFRPSKRTSLPSLIMEERLVEEAGARFDS